MSSVVILTPSPYSLYTLGVIVGLKRANVNIAGVGVRRLINPRRVLSEARRDGWRLAGKIWRKLVARKKVYEQERRGSKTASSYLEDHDIQLMSVPNICKEFGIDLFHCNDLNDAGFVDRIRAIGPEMIVFTGGGLVRRALLEAAPMGILNAHQGMLPAYRGMDVAEWAVVQDEPAGVGVAVHIMEAGVDTGPILSSHPVALEPGDNYKAIQDRIDYTQIEAMVETATAYLAGTIEPQPQQVEDGKQYFVMDPYLKAYARKKLAEVLA